MRWNLKVLFLKLLSMSCKFCVNSLKILNNSVNSFIFHCFNFSLISSNVSQNVEENVGTVDLSVMRSKGLLGRVSVDILTVPGTATFQTSSTNIELAEIQTVAATRISAWCKISSGEATYILMITSLNANEHLRMLVGKSDLQDGQSVLYRWQGELTYIRVSQR